MVGTVFGKIFGSLENKKATLCVAFFVLNEI